MKAKVLPALAMLVLLCSTGFAYQLSDHPRMFVNKQTLPELASRAQGAQAAEYATVKALADSALTRGIKDPGGPWRPPIDMVCLGLTYLIERQLGHDASRYIAPIKTFWGADGKRLSLKEGDG
jgi:hypothetical protein